MSTNVYSLQYDVQIEYTSTVPIYSADTGEYEWYVYNMMYRVYLPIYSAYTGEYEWYVYNMMYRGYLPMYSAYTGEYEWYVYNMMYRVYLSIYWRPALHVRAVNLPPPPELKCLPEIDYLKILHRCSRGT